MNQLNLFESGSAIFSPCRKYRYTLWRVWGNKDNFVQFICLNPSTADEFNNDPTIRRCIDFARTWGYGALCMTNLFAYRATDPNEMKKVEFPIGEDNDKWLVETSQKARLIIAAWSQHGKHLNRASIVRKLIVCKMFYLKISKKTGQPYHPLYLPRLTKPQLFI